MAYEEIEMPDRFVLECLTATGDWIDLGLYDADAFQRQDDGAYVCRGHGSPLWLRCVRQDGQVLYAVDGARLPFTHRLVEFAGDGYA